jgi:hypothetical protein
LILSGTCNAWHTFLMGRKNTWWSSGLRWIFEFGFPFISGLRQKTAVLEINELPFIGRADSRWKAAKRWLFLQLIVPQYQGFICISSNLSQLILQHKKKRAQVVQIPILIDPNKTFEAANATAAKSYLVHAGSLSEEKDGISGVLSAFSILKSEHRHTQN